VTGCMLLSGSSIRVIWICGCECSGRSSNSRGCCECCGSRGEGRETSVRDDVAGVLETPAAIRRRSLPAVSSSIQILMRRSRRPAARYANIAFFLSSEAPTACSKRTKLAWNSNCAPSCSASPPSPSAPVKVHKTTKISCQS
jgi:hypothetical protein